MRNVASTDAMLLGSKTRRQYWKFKFIRILSIKILYYHDIVEKKKISLSI